MAQGILSDSGNIDYDIYFMFDGEYVSRDSVIPFAESGLSVLHTVLIIHSIDYKAANRMYSVVDKTIVRSVEFRLSSLAVLFLMKVFGRKSDDKHA